MTDEICHCGQPGTVREWGRGSDDLHEAPLCANHWLHGVDWPVIDGSRGIDPYEHERRWMARQKTSGSGDISGTSRTPVPVAERPPRREESGGIHHERVYPGALTAGDWGVDQDPYTREQSEGDLSLDRAWPEPDWGHGWQLCTGCGQVFVERGQPADLERVFQGICELHVECASEHPEKRTHNLGAWVAAGLRALNYNRSPIPSYAERVLRGVEQSISTEPLHPNDYEFKDGDHDRPLAKTTRASLVADLYAKHDGFMSESEAGVHIDRLGRALTGHFDGWRWATIKKWGVDL